MSLWEAKRRLREESTERRRRAGAAAGSGAAERLADHFLAAVPLLAGAAVSGYWPMRDEIDPRPLMRRLHESGHLCGLPVVVARGEALIFRAWSPGLALEVTAFGVSEPPAEAAPVTPDLLLVPLLAVDPGGYRLGYGGGYFDRTLAALRGAGRRVLAVGLAYGAQEVAELPRTPGDERLDWVVSEREARKIG
ncbi:MAG: 5-formyltetrahydrofolate cyclo-ligase [Alphaproteobacteria bacterium]